MTEEEMAQRVAEAAEHGCPNDRHGQIRLIAGYQAGLGIGVTLRALQIILERTDGRTSEQRSETRARH